MFTLNNAFGDKNDLIKEELMSLFVKNMNGNFLYSSEKYLYEGDIGDLYSLDFVKRYDCIDKQEDSVSYKIKSSEEEIINIYGLEVQTSKKVKTRNNGHYYNISNHFYLLKVVFNNPKFNINTPIKLMQDFSDNHVKKVLKVLSIQFTFIFIILITLFGNKNSSSILEDFIYLVKTNLEISIVFLLGMFFIIYFIYNYMLGNNRIKVENLKFERKFDVYSNNKIESRRLLTPSFMYRIVDFVNKISKKRVYEFLFYRNYFYLKLNIMATNSILNLNPFASNNYLEFSSYKSINKNLEKFVEFYLEMKNITTLTKELIE